MNRTPSEEEYNKYLIAKEVLEEWQEEMDISKWDMHTFWNFLNNQTK